MRKLNRILLPVFIALVLLVAAQVVLAAVWPTNHLDLSRSTLDAGYPAVAVSSDGQNIGFVWSQGASGSTANTAQGPLYLKMASDGITISVRTALDIAGESLMPDIASDPQNANDYMYVVWKNLQNDATTIKLRRCATTGGCTGAVTLQSVATVNHDLNNPRIATSKQSNGNTVVHVVWQAVDQVPNPDVKVIMYASGYWSGSGTWVPLHAPASVSETSPWGTHPAVAVSTTGGNGQTVHVAWANDANRNEVNESILYRRGTLNTTNGAFSSWVAAASGYNAGTIVTGNENPDYPALAAFQNRVMMLWDEKLSSASDPTPDSDEYFLAYFFSTDNGATFGTQNVLRNTVPEVVTYVSDRFPTSGPSPNDLGNHGERLQVDVAAESADIFHIVWHTNMYTDTSDTYHDVFYNEWSSSSGWAHNFAIRNGSNETTDEIVTGEALKYLSPYQTQDKPYVSMSPDIAVSAAGDVYAVYMEGDTNFGYSLAVADFDVIYNGTVRLTDTTTLGDGGVYLPIIMKRAS